MNHKLISSKMAFVTDVHKDAKNDDAMRDFVLKHPDFTGTVTLMKDTKYKESNGDVHRRHYDYDVEKGKYRKKLFSNKGKWKVIIPTE